MLGLTKLETLFFFLLQPQQKILLQMNSLNSLSNFLVNEVTDCSKGLDWTCVAVCHLSERMVLAFLFLLCFIWDRLCYLVPLCKQPPSPAACVCLQAWRGHLTSIKSSTSGLCGHLVICLRFHLSLISTLFMKYLRKEGHYRPSSESIEELDCLI